MRISSEEVEKFKLALQQYERERDFTEYAKAHKKDKYIAWALFLSWCVFSYDNRQFLYGGLCLFAPFLAFPLGANIAVAVFLLLPISFYFWGNWYTFAGYVLLFFALVFALQTTPPEKNTEFSKNRGEK